MYIHWKVSYNNCNSKFNAYISLNFFQYNNMANSLPFTMIYNKLKKHLKCCYFIFLNSKTPIYMSYRYIF